MKQSVHEAPADGCAGREEQPFAFRYAFQPIIKHASRDLCWEALLRGPQGEPAREVLALVADRHRAVFEQAGRMAAIRLAGQLGLRGSLSLNVGVHCLVDAGRCLQRTVNWAEEMGLLPRQLIFEISEKDYVCDPKQAQRMVTAYRSEGVRIALDNFGADFGGLEVLADFRPDIVKLDRRLVADLPQNRVNHSIIDSVIRLAGELDYEIVAEGVETLSELQALRGMGVNAYQGFFFARPALEELQFPPEWEHQLE